MKKEMLVGKIKGELGTAIEQWELEYGKMNPKQKFIYRAGWNAGRVSLRKEKKKKIRR